MLLNLIALLCAGSAWLVSRRAPQHRPVAIALTICALLDVVRSVVPLPPRVDMALCLGAPAVSLWLYLTVFDRPGYAEWLVAALVWIFGATMAQTVPSEKWALLVPMLYIVPACAAIGTIAAHVQHRLPWTVTQRTAAMLLAGDVAGLLLLVRRDWVHFQAGVVLALVTWYQVWWIWRRQDDGN